MKYIYGPVQSRRLGLSLGISLTPYKFCSLDCVYCQLGPTQTKTQERGIYTPVEEILQEFKGIIASEIFKQIDYISFSGFGEPMLNAKISSLIAGIRGLCDKKISLITNSTLLVDSDARREILNVDLIVPSLDAASQEIFEKIDKPVSGLKIEEIINGLVLLRKEFSRQIWLEIMFVKGLNDSENELDLLRAAVDKINPNKIQLNSPVRAPKDFRLKALSRKRLEEIKEFFGPRAEII